jgi:phage-related protein
MEELLQRVLQILGKTEEEFNHEVEEVKEKSLVNQNFDSMADVVAFLIVNSDAMAQANAELITRIIDLENKVQQLEGNTNA